MRSNGQWLDIRGNLSLRVLRQSIWLAIGTVNKTWKHSIWVDCWNKNRKPQMLSETTFSEDSVVFAMTILKLHLRIRAPETPLGPKIVRLKMVRFSSLKPFKSPKPFCSLKLTLIYCVTIVQKLFYRYIHCQNWYVWQPFIFLQVKTSSKPVSSC